MGVLNFRHFNTTDNVFQDSRSSSVQVASYWEGPVGASTVHSNRIDNALLKKKYRVENIAYIIVVTENNWPHLRQ